MGQVLGKTLEHGDGASSLGANYSTGGGANDPTTKEALTRLFLPYFFPGDFGGAGGGGGAGDDSTGSSTTFGSGGGGAGAIGAGGSAARGTDTSTSDTGSGGCGGGGGGVVLIYTPISRYRRLAFQPKAVMEELVIPVVNGLVPEVAVVVLWV